MDYIYYISYITYYNNFNPYEPVFDVLDGFYFKSEEDARSYIKTNTNLKYDEYTIEKLKLYNEEAESIPLF